MSHLHSQPSIHGFIQPVFTEHLLSSMCLPWAKHCVVSGDQITYFPPSVHPPVDLNLDMRFKSCPRYSYRPLTWIPVLSSHLPSLPTHILPAGFSSTKKSGHVAQHPSFPVPDRSNLNSMVCTHCLVTQPPLPSQLQLLPFHPTAPI